MSKMKKVLWIALIVSILLSLPGIGSRFQVEWNNRTYEMLIPYENIEDLAQKDRKLDEVKVLNRLKEAGLQGVSLEPATLASLQENGIVSILSYQNIKEMSLFDSEFEELLEDQPIDQLFVIPHEESILIDHLETAFEDTEEVTFKGKEMILIPGYEDELRWEPLGYDLDSCSKD